MKTTNKAAFTFVDSIPFNDVRTTYTSESFNCSDYREFCLLVDKAVSGTPTTVQIQVQVSDDNVTFRDIATGFWGTLYYEDSAGTQNEAMKDTCPYMYMRVYIVAVGTGASDTFTVTVKGIFMN